ncbi:aldehyde dehydrogenase (NAD+) [Roseimicrobium gellanilyticum]|uniref:aldehyde dehydrogenase (NAD(+)) n=1 Tax=Roseimicrobium gellanilyticum TaxID=748857 RepID=A0A366HNG3_9BACT|nr:aldehyde dehydrogenase family protein [Roseimicrobium gellanilyticum]RBP45036.1 aldehyde dehydrogenase (NAD+) [Roseimicrobium gellanilyticum]
MDSCLQRLGLSALNGGAFDGAWSGNGDVVESISPINGQVIARVKQADAGDCERGIARAQEAFLKWRVTPAPVRGETVRRLGNAFRVHKADLGRLVTLEMGKILAEGEGEVQEMIDICDFAVGLSRQLHGLTIASERPNHRLMEQWHPLGIIGVITAFNFPVAVWSWNAALAAVCGDSVIWKPSSHTPLCAIAVTRIAEQVCRETGVDPAIFTLLCGSVEDVGSRMVEDRRLPLISATGSCAMGHKLAQQVHARLGRTLLELGGNNAVIVTPSADLELAVRAIFFGAVGTAGQRCTSTRRVIVHESVADALRERLVRAYHDLRIGDPLDPATLMGPLINRQAVATMIHAIRRLKREGGTVLSGGKILHSDIATVLAIEHLADEGGPFLPEDDELLREDAFPGGCYVTPCLASVTAGLSVVREETFAPILYLMKYRDFNEALAMHNDVPQGLSSAIFTNDFREAELFLSAVGSDCGIANVNAGTSGAEIGGAFGGEKDTGGGRESGSDAWKNYMRRQTNTINYGKDMPLAQGIHFGEDPAK